LTHALLWKPFLSFVLGNEAIWLILWLRDEISQAHARALLGRVAHLF